MTAVYNIETADNHNYYLLASKVLPHNCNIGSKITNQMARRGWTSELIENIVNNPFTTRNAINKATGNAATAFFEKSGSYVVKDNVTNDIIQISNRLDPNWAPDATIINPYIRR